MSDLHHITIHLERAKESLSGAESEFANRRFHNCANRAYYACYQTAVATLFHAGIQPTGSRWGHDTVQAQFAGELINRRKRYSPELRNTFDRIFLIRQTADYTIGTVSEIQAARVVRRARTFVEEVTKVIGSAK